MAQEGHMSKDWGSPTTVYRLNNGDYLLVRPGRRPVMVTAPICQGESLEDAQNRLAALISILQEAELSP